MHIFFSGIGGAGIGPLASVAHQVGYIVSGSDKQDSSYLEYLRDRGIHDIHVGQSEQIISDLHNKTPIDWFIYSSALPIEQPNHPELVFAKDHGIKISKRDEFLNKLLDDHDLRLIAVAGTHGKTTTTAMVIWLFKQLDLPISYSLGAKLSFGDMSQFDPISDYFVYECDEFDRNFLAFHPYLSLITGVTWDHHEIFITRRDYQDAFRDFIAQSQQTILWDEDRSYLELPNQSSITVHDHDSPELKKITLAGAYNRRDAWLAIQGVARITGESPDRLVGLMNTFPGLQRRMEEIIPSLYSDYAHTPEKIRGAMSAGLEIAAQNEQDLVVLYEPLTDRRQHYMINDYKDCFAGASQVYWLPSYLAREDPSQRVLKPEELIVRLTDSSIAVPAETGVELKRTIAAHLTKGDMVVAMAGGGGGSLDDWLRANFAN